MRSSTRTRHRSRSPLRLALVLLVISLPLLGATEVEPVRPGIAGVAAGVTAGQVVLIVDVRGVGDGFLPPESFSATVHGTAQSGRVGPLLSDQLALSIVVDASEAAGPVLPDGIRGAGTFLLAAVPSTRSAVIADAAPPSVLVPMQPGPAAALRALTSLQAQGERRTSQALDLAVRQLPTGAADPRLVVLHTSAPDAGGEPAADLAERLSDARVPLAVVAAVADGQPVPSYWSTVATATGGVAVGAPAGTAVDAFDRLTAALRTRYLMTFPAPARLPATAVVRVETPNGPLTTDVVIQRATSRPGAAAVGGVVLPVAIGVGALLVIGLVVAATLRRRGWRRTGPPVTAPAGQVSNVPARPDLIAGREPLLAAVRKVLDSGERTLLHVPDDRRGVGASTAMIEFAARYRSRYDIAWWIPAEDPGLIPDRLAELAERLGLAAATDEAEPALARLLEALSRRDRWLLVFEDAENPRELARFLPSGSGHVVVISQVAGWREVATPVAVPAFTRVESVALLRSRLPDLSVDQADRLAAAVDDLPLALDPASAMLADTGMGVDRYLRLLRDRQTNPATGRGGDPGAPIAWMIAVDRLRADDPAALALLTVLAWLGPDPVPRRLFTGHWDELPAPLSDAARDPSRFAERLATLRRRGLARVTPHGVWLHRVPASMLVSRTGREGNNGTDWPAVAVRLLGAAVAEAPPDDPASWPTWRQLLSHVLVVTDPARALNGVSEDVGRLLESAATYLQARGADRIASVLFEDAGELGGRRLGANRPDRLASAGKAGRQQPADRR